MSNEGFVTWLKYFVDVVKPTKEETIVLIFDGHVTHTKNLVSIEIALEAGVVMVSLPPHTTYRLQPLGVAFVGPFGKYYDDALRMWMREDVGRPVTWQVAEILNVAYGKAASIQNAVRGFRKTGQWPLTIDLFQDSDFGVAMVIYAITEAAQEHNHTPPLTPVVAAPALTAAATEAVPELCPPLPLPMLPRMSTGHGYNQRKELNLKHAIDLSPLPVTKSMVRKRTLTIFHACELTCSRYINNLVEKTMMPNKSKPERRKKLVKLSKVGPEKAMPTRLNREHTKVLIHPNLVDYTSSKTAELVNGASFCTLMKYIQA